MGPVVVRNDVLAKLPAVLVLLIVDAAFAWGIVAAIATGDPGWQIRSALDPGRRGEIVWWVIMGPVQLGLFYLTALLFRLRMEFWPDRLRVRRVLRWRTIRLDDITEIALRDATIHGGRLGKDTIPRLLVRSRSGRQAFLQPWLTNVRAALKVVDGWVALRPELVRGRDTEQWYVARGALSDTTSQRRT